MERSYKCGDVIEYLGVRYYVVQNAGEDWLCINGHTFNACLLPKTKLSKFIGESNGLRKTNLDRFFGRWKWGLNGLNQKRICHRMASQ